MKVKDVVAKLLKRNQEEEICCMVWDAEDILNRSTERGIKITTTQALQVLLTLEDEHHNDIGINTEEIDYWINEILEEE